MFFDCGNDIFAIDSKYMREHFDAVYVIKRGGEAAIVETANNASLAIVLDDLPKIGVRRDDVKYVFVTHVHLDHAGGAGSYMREFGGATLVVHPRGAKHMADPRRLYMGACGVYGAENARRLYGDVLPIPQSRIVSPADGESVSLGETSLTCFDAPGHALHHNVYHLKDANVVFTGDSFGMTHDEFRSPHRVGVLPTTSPVQFDPDAMIASIDMVLSLAPSEIMLTHFLGIKDAATAAEDLRRMIRWHVASAVEGRGDFGEISKLLYAHFDEERAIQGWPYNGDGVRRWIDNVVEMNAKGLVDWYAKKFPEGIE